VASSCRLRRGTFQLPSPLPPPLPLPPAMLFERDGAAAGGVKLPLCEGRRCLCFCFRLCFCASRCCGEPRGAIFFSPAPMAYAMVCVARAARPATALTRPADAATLVTVSGSEHAASAWVCAAAVLTAADDDAIAVAAAAPRDVPAATMDAPVAAAAAALASHDAEVAAAVTVAAAADELKK